MVCLVIPLLRVLTAYFKLLSPDAHSLRASETWRAWTLDNSHTRRREIKGGNFFLQEMGSGTGNFLKVVLKNIDVLAGYVRLFPLFHFYQFLQTPKKILSENESLLSRKGNFFSWERTFSVKCKLPFPIPFSRSFTVKYGVSLSWEFPYFMGKIFLGSKWKGKKITGDEKSKFGCKKMFF